MATKSDPASIQVIPGSPEYAEQVEALQSAVYHVVAAQHDDCITAAKFRDYLNIFPEGQFLALDVTRDQVVGVTASMRFNFDPTQPLLEPWNTTTGYG
jgi:hypothetical protein